MSKSSEQLSKDLGGFAGRIGIVDLSAGTVRTMPLDPETAIDYLGGLGLAVKLVHDYLKPGADSLSPGNVIVIGAGPMVGTDLPASSRVFGLTKLPASNSVGWAGGGGYRFGALFKSSGFDQIVITGASHYPVYLEIDNDELSIKDASSLWGKGVKEANQELAGEDGGTITIGPAGENRAVMSMAFVDAISTMGRGGFGAVMGSKNLKAFAVRNPCQGVKIARPKEYRELKNKLMKTIREYPYLKDWQDKGQIKTFPALTMEDYEKIRYRRLACVSCPIGDKDSVRIADGEFKGNYISTTSVTNLFYAKTQGFKDHGESMTFIAQLDDLGLDKFEFFSIMRFAMDLTDKGILNNDLLPEPIDTTSFSSMSVWAEMIAHRQGFGAVIADGFLAIIDELGPEALKLAPSLIKGMHPYIEPKPGQDAMRFGTMELGQITDPRGPHIAASGSPTYFAKRPLSVFPKHMKRQGIPDEAQDRIMPDGLTGNSLKVGRYLKYSQTWFTILGSLGICARAQINRFYSADALAELYSAVTGVDTSLDQLRKNASRAWTLLRLINIREAELRQEKEAGQKEVQNEIPEPWIKNFMFKDYQTEKPLEEDDYLRALGDYYDEWGWDRETGRPTEETLKALGLDNLD